MSAPVMSPQGERLRERTQPLAPDDETHGWAHALLCEALSKPLVQVGEVFDPEGDVPPLAPILSVELCPSWALPWLAQIKGVQLPQGVDDATARELITNVAGFARGTPAALRAAASLHLTGNQTLYFRERDGGDPYVLEVLTRTSETPDPELVLNTLLAAKPAGLVLTHRVVDSWDWQEVGIELATWADLTATYSTWRNLVLKEPI